MKFWLTSKTIWVNTLVALSLILSATEIVAIVPIAWIPYLAAGNSIVNIILRVWFTKQAIKR